MLMRAIARTFLRLAGAWSEDPERRVEPTVCWEANFVPRLVVRDPLVRDEFDMS
jgi:hypothetical protein